jgi:hypothetical protein
MAKIKSSELTVSLSGHERKLFDQYLQSPFFNCSREVGVLFNSFSMNTSVNREELFKTLYPDQKYDDKKLRYLISDLNKHIQYFLMLRHLEKDPLQEKVITAKAVSAKNCDKSYSLLHQEITNHSASGNAGLHLQQFEHAELHLNFSNKNATRKTTPDYTSTLFHLDTFYVLKKLQLACEVTNLANILKKNYDLLLMNEIRELATNKVFSEIPLIGIYVNILNMLSSSKNEENFVKAKSLLKKDGANIRANELSELYQYIRNFCVRKINEGNTEYLRTLFEIYNDMLGNPPLMNHDYLSQWEYKNIVTISLRLGEVSWCENFIKKYINYLHPGERINALAYNTAYLHFMKNEYHKSIRKLQEVELTDVFYQLDARVIILKSYYELDEWEAFFYQASAFRLFLLRNKGISEYQKTIYRNLIKFITAIMRASTSVAKLKRIKAEIEKEKNVADLNWLMKRVEIAIG